MNNRYFGTDGIRGLANYEPMTAETVLKLGKSLVHYLKTVKGSGCKNILIGKDTRLSGYMFEQAISAGIISMGSNVQLLGPIPTPAISFLTTDMRADAGIVISASHNPYQDNGIKFFDSKGLKFEEKSENIIENILIKKEYLQSNGDGIGKAFRIDDASGRYIVYLKNTFPKNYNLKGIKIVIDCSNGAAYKVSPLVLSELGAEVITMSNKPDGKNINHNCGALHPENLQKRVVEEKADMGIALDGDADRVIFVDNRGNIVDGDKILALVIDDIVDRFGARNSFVITEMSNISLHRFIESKKADYYITQVGDKYVVNEMIKCKSRFGGEKSGHLIFMDYSNSGDGTLSAIQLLAIILRKSKSLFELSHIIDLYPQLLVNIKVKNKIPFGKIPKLNRLVKTSKKALGEEYRINIRYSGTEMLARVMVEGEDEVKISNVARDISNIIEKHIGI